MGGEDFIPLRKSNREAAAVAGGDRVKVRIVADAEERVVDVPGDLTEALKAGSGLWNLWQGLSYTHRRECVETVLAAKKPETRQRRIARVVSFVRTKQGTKAT
jgi:uncharacterized protein YdeI (YjbR/CyaY-like superfamily)